MGTAQSPLGEQAGSPAYLQIVRFKRDAAAKRVFTAAQEAIFHAECDLSVYNLRFNGEPTLVGRTRRGKSDEVRWRIALSVLCSGRSRTTARSRRYFAGGDSSYIERVRFLGDGEDAMTAAAPTA